LGLLTFLITHLLAKAATTTCVSMTRRKRPRGSRGARTNAININDGNASSGASDLMVMLPQGSVIKTKVQIKEIIDRLSSTGHSQMALVHTIYGRPRPEDSPELAIPSSLWTSSFPNGKPPIRILRRLHVVLESLSDVGIYMSKGPHETMINGYDLVSVSPRNEAVFQSACASASVADIISLDYTIRGVRLPYKIRPADAKAVIDRQAAFEIPLAPGLLHVKQRKALVQTCRELQRSCLGLKPIVIVGSGDRSFEESDVGTMAFRMPGDISNLLQTVLQFDVKTSQNAIKASGMAVVNRAENRRFGRSDISKVFFHEKGKDSPLSPTKKGNDDVTAEPPAKIQKLSVEHHEEADASDNAVNDDGFINIST
jgi:RNase P/RNase MRP subunit p30